MIILPNNLSSLNILKEERRLIESVKNRLSDEYIALAQVNVTGNEDQSFTAIISPKGLLLINMIGLGDDFNWNEISVKFLLDIKNQIVDIVNKKLASHSRLLVKEKLKIPVNVILFFFNKINPINSINQFSNELKKDIFNSFRFSEWLKEFSINPVKEIDNAIQSFSAFPCENFDKLDIDIIINRIAPWYTIPRIEESQTETDISKISDHKQFVDASNSKINVFRLDDYQVNFINSLGLGNHLILACAGSGKSVLLISKCFRIASLDSRKKYLITCFNKNLANYYNWQIDEAGFRDRNVVCKSFFQLCYSLLSEIGMHPSQSNSEEDWNRLSESVLINIRNGKIKQKFFGIFIDEVQIFNPLWYRICYMLLENPKNDSHIFVICGDLTQNVRKNVKNGTAPWQGEDDLPKFFGKGRRIEKNYRNCIQINEFINKYVDVAHKYIQALEITIKEIDDIFLRGKASLNGNNPQCIQFNEFNSGCEAEYIVNSIKYMHDVDKIPYTEIAVLVHSATGKRGNSQWEEDHYCGKIRIYDSIKAAGIHCDKLSWESENRTTYGARRGVSFITYEGALGLDFRGVIVAGVHRIGMKEGVYDEKLLDCTDISEENKQVILQSFNTIYTACTRAKESLHIILPNSKFNSIYRKLLTESFSKFVNEEINENATNN